MSISPAGLGVLNRLAARKSPAEKSPSTIASFAGVSDGFATFITSTGDSVSMPVANVITSQAWTGTFAVTRPKFGYPYAYKEV